MATQHCSLFHASTSKSQSLSRSPHTSLFTTTSSNCQHGSVSSLSGQKNQDLVDGDECYETLHQSYLCSYQYDEMASWGVSFGWKNFVAGMVTVEDARVS